MFCGYCGKKIEKEAKVCPNCGKRFPVDETDTTVSLSPEMEPNMLGNEKLIYESKGCSKMQMGGVIFFLLLAIVGACMCFGLRNAKYKSSTVSSGYITDGVYHETSVGYLGGGFKFNSEGRQMLLIMGVIALGTAMLFAEYLIGMSRCWVKVYENHVEGQNFIIGFIKSQFYFTIQEITAVDMQYKFVVVSKGKARYLLLCQDQRELFELLNQKRLSA